MLIFGLGAIIATVINYIMFLRKKDFTIPMVIALALTSLELVSEYSLAAKWVETNDMSALLDVVIYMDNALWVLTILSITLNILPLVLSKITKTLKPINQIKKESK